MTTPKQIHEKRWRKYRMVAMGVTALIIGGLITFIYSIEPKAATANIEHGVPVAYHHHVRLEVYENGQRISVPSNIGITGFDTASSPLGQYGPAGMSPVHTHNFDGVIHIEPTQNVQFTLGDFLQLWDHDISGHKSITLYVNGIPQPDYKTYILDNGQSLKLEIKDY